MSTFLHLGNIGLALSIVGVVFLANSIGIRNPRRFIQEFFGIERQRPLRGVLDQLRAKAQIFTGFLFLMIGFALQIVASTIPVRVVAPGDVSSAERWQGLAALALGVIVVSLLMRVAQNAWALATFRRLLAEFFGDHRDWNFEKHPALTRELGELLAIPAEEDDSISEYAERVRGALGLQRARGPSGTRAGNDRFTPMRDVGAERGP